MGAVRSSIEIKTRVDCDNSRSPDLLVLTPIPCGCAWPVPLSMLIGYAMEACAFTVTPDTTRGPLRFEVRNVCRR